MSPNVTAALSARKRSTMPAPRPEAPPVTTATLACQFVAHHGSQSVDASQVKRVT